MSNEIDGIIKYNFDFQQTEPLSKELWCEIEEVRERLYRLNMIGVYPNGIGFGNISQRINNKSFVITGTQTGDLSHLSSEHYSLVVEFDDSKFYLKSKGAIKASSEALTHGTIYNLSDDINAVIHIHSLHLWKFMIAKNFLITNNVPYGSQEMIDDIKNLYTINSLSNSKFAMVGHEEGIIIFGKNIKEAELNLLELLGDFINTQD
jgi:ribulose-5-phosphate 4-epimerase/fuculose-1-phosphate aldolase